MEKLDWDKWSELERLQPVLDPHDTRGLKNVLIDQIQWNVLKKCLRNSKNILDFGCGIGRFARRIKCMGINYTGIDLSAAMIKKAEKNKDVGINFIHLKENFPFQDSSFDTVSSCTVFTYILKTSTEQKTISEIYRVLKPAGRLILMEEASISQRKSESAQLVATQDDYINALSASFEILQIAKVRSPDFSKLGCRILESQKINLSLFKYIVGPLAQYEAGLVAKAPDDYFKTTSYFDFIIVAQARK